ncbi:MULTISPECIES: hypothetical protein [Thermomonospora]|uniref:DNA-binding IclR family transcriptional regulator n=1 Tax=Thermomonospora cellulosilytica TaxID=1411118 RepID=A0A7W3MZI3_9ACTN|nr:MULTISPECIES: hypothetical protein [Thermomonospora]MBA9004765.1 DNA-binding IclR family transcriptional regulator [Thermomonospora cellulosilytica]
MRDERADVQGLTDLELYVYDAVASADTGGRALGETDITEIAAETGRGEDEVRRALEHLVELNHLRSRSAGYTLGPHDWAP